MTEWLAVFIGGGLGALVRWQFQFNWNEADQIPWGTFVANIVGGLLAGVCLALVDRLPGELKLFLVTGILGGLTTFSALSAEIVGMLSRGAVFPAFAYGMGSMMAGVLVCGLGYWLTSR